MLISIVTPAYNAERHLAATVASVLAQTHAEWEQVIVDDGSRDGTLELARACALRDARIRVHRQENRGVAGARNAGYELLSARSQLVIFLDSDDVWRPRCLESLARTLQLNAAAPAAHGKVECIDAHGRAIPMAGYELLGRRYLSSSGKLARLADDAPTNFAVLAVLNSITTPGQVLIRRSAFDRAGKFDCRTGGAAEDWDLWLRLALQAPLAFLPETVLDYRRRAGNASPLRPHLRRCELYVRHKTILATAAQPEAHSVARAALRYAERVRSIDRLRLAARHFRDGNWQDAARDVARASTSAATYARSLLLSGGIERSFKCPQSAP
jgi:glycosyltransferase involved in cell wall biosynthesis